jgi:hypothetical protein
MTDAEQQQQPAPTATVTDGDWQRAADGTFVGVSTTDQRALLVFEDGGRFAIGCWFDAFELRCVEGIGEGEFVALDDVAVTVDAQDWQDIISSEFVDCATAMPRGRDRTVGFVFEHDDIGLHGIRYHAVGDRLHACSFTREGGDSA